MIVSVDDDLCGGHGVCCSIAPGVFVLSDDGYAEVVTPEVPPELEEAVLTAVKRCPNRAISVS
ncbi:MAG TPA: ferredoxin [Acidimicrobiales bacterium]